MQATLLDHAHHKAAEGIELASRNAGEEWKAHALDFVHHYLTTHRELFVDDLWESGLPEPSSPRALGAVLRIAVSNGWMSEKTSPDGNILARPSRRSHGQLKRVWKSEIFTA